MPVQQASGELLAESPGAVAEVLMNRAKTAIENCAASAPIVESYVVLGEVAWDECCGVLIGVPLRTYRSRQFPLPATDTTNCDDTFLCVDVAVVLLRCVPVIDANGVVPTVEDQNQAAMDAARDAAVILNEFTNSLPEGWEQASMEQTIEGADGGCIAIDTRFTVGLPQYEWCLDCDVAP